ncbi:MAG: hypothetical protein E7640_03250 [Ruminococcaceae bacterium]|nr:hypothetical protein [Oscillospiraceae bacterium]
MKILIAYAGRVGVTAECAEMLRLALGDRDVTVCDLSVSTPKLGEYDTVVVGTSIYYGKPEKAVVKFIKEKASELESKHFAGYICAAFADRVDEYIEDTFPPRLRMAAVDISYFGGELKPDRQKNFLMRAIVRSMRNEIINNGDSDDESMVRILPEINPTEISKLSDRLKKL